MLHKWLLITLFFTIHSVYGDQLRIKSNAPTSYIVKKGDTLWDISTIYLESPWRWPELWQHNTHIENPHLIYPGDQLALTYNSQGEPRLVLNQKPIKQLIPQLKIQPKTPPIPTITATWLQQYTPTNLLLSPTEVAKSHIVLGANVAVKLAVTGHILNVEIEEALAVDERYFIYRPLRDLIDPETTQSIGFIYEKIAETQVIFSGKVSNKTPAQLEIKTVKKAVQQGDLAIRATETSFSNTPVELRQPQQAVHAKIIAGYDQHSFLAKHDIMVLNQGQAQHIQNDTIYPIYYRPPKVSLTKEGPLYTAHIPSVQQSLLEIEDERMMAALPIGQALIVKSYQHFAYALILRSTQPVKIGDLLYFQPEQ